MVRSVRLKARPWSSRFASASSSDCAEGASNQSSKRNSGSISRGTPREGGKFAASSCGCEPAPAQVSSTCGSAANTVWRRPSLALERSAARAAPSFASRAACVARKQPIAVPTAKAMTPRLMPRVKSTRASMPAPASAARAAWGSPEHRQGREEGCGAEKHSWTPGQRCKPAPARLHRPAAPHRRLWASRRVLNAATDCYGGASTGVV